METLCKEAKTRQQAKVIPKARKQAMSSKASNTKTPTSSTARHRTATETPPTSTPALTTPAEKPAAEPTPAKPDYRALFKQLIARANAGEHEAIVRLRRFLDLNPQIWQEAGNLTAVAERAWIELIAGGEDVFRTDSIKRRLEDLKAELKGPHPTQLESLLIDQIAVTWLGSQHAEIMAASAATGSLDQAAFKLKRAESSQRRHLSAIKMLGTLRSFMPQALLPSNAGVRLFDPQREQA